MKTGKWWLLLALALAAGLLRLPPAAVEADTSLGNIPAPQESPAAVQQGPRYIALTFDDGPRRIHTYDHVLLTGLNGADFAAQVERSRTLLKQILGHNDFLLRPPYGILDEGVKSRAGCPIILWSIDPEDWKDRNAQREAELILSQARDGSIILMHDIFPESVDAALQVVDALHQQGYLFCTIEELFDLRGIPLEAGQVYCDAYP